MAAVVSRLACYLVSRSAYSSTLKTVALCSSETLVDFQGTARLYIIEDSSAHNHRFGNLKAYDRSHAVHFGIMNTSTCGINLRIPYGQHSVMLDMLPRNCNLHDLHVGVSVCCMFGRNYFNSKSIIINTKWCA
jgi:hypothetical protein